MTDNELLEKAAKIASINNSNWNPLTNDSDALQLLVILKLSIWRSRWPNGRRYVAAYKEWHTNDSMYYDLGISLDDMDEFTATRRAIVCAAAAIYAKSMVNNNG